MLSNVSHLKHLQTLYVTERLPLPFTVQTVTVELRKFRDKLEFDALSLRGPITLVLKRQGSRRK